MNLSPEQLKAVQEGNAVRVVAPEVGAECVVMRADAYERVQAVLSLDMRQVALLVEVGMREYDDRDPLLESYQQ